MTVRPERARNVKPGAWAEPLRAITLITQIGCFRERKVPSVDYTAARYSWILRATVERVKNLRSHVLLALRIPRLVLQNEGSGIQRSKVEVGGRAENSTILRKYIKGRSLRYCVWTAPAQFVHVTATFLHIASNLVRIECATGGTVLVSLCRHSALRQLFSHRRG